MANVDLDRLAREKVRAAELALLDGARSDYYSYVKYVHAGRWKDTRFHRYLCGKIQEFVESPGDPAYDILVIQTMPQSGKSTSLTETLPSWYLGKNPMHRVIEVSYSEDFAARFGRANKRKISDYCGQLFGIELATTPNSATEFQLTNNVGGMISRGVMSGVTGNPANLVIIDDPLKSRAEADSITIRDTIWNEWQNSIKTRLQARSKVIVVMTRWHENDLVGRILETEKNVTLLSFPCECEDPETDLLGRAMGEPLVPEIGKDADWLESFKMSYIANDGARAWNALFQQRPSSAEGNMLLREYWEWCDKLPAVMPFTCITVDATFKDTKRSDKMAVQAWGKHNAKFYCIASTANRVNFLGALDEVTNMIRTLKGITGRPPNAIYIESAANGEAIINVLRERVEGVIPVKATESKEARVQSVLPLLEAHQVYLWRECAGAQELIEECAVFPNGSNDDRVDALSMALNKLRNIDASTSEATSAEDFFGVFTAKPDNFLGAEIGRQYIDFGC